MHEIVTLDQLHVAARERIADELFVGAQSTRVELIDGDVMGKLVASINAYVLSEHAGPAVTEQVTATLPDRPWWLPRVVWRRIPWHDTTWTLTVRPRWVYPQATMKIPALGPAVLFAETVHAPHRDEPDWRVHP